MKNKQKGFAPIIIIVLVIVIIAAVYYFYSNNKTDVANDVTTVTTTSETNTQASSTAETSTSSNLIGKYTFSEFAKPNQTWAYNLTIASSVVPKQLKLTLAVNGVETLISLNATANTGGKSLDVIFNSYQDANKYPTFKQGDILFTLTPTASGLAIEWKKMKPMVDANITGSVFKKTAN